MAYRLGMTMTEWVARALIGLPATTHHEDAAPFGAGSNWFGPGKRPDLWSEDPYRTPAVWALEAKGARRLAKRNLREGAQQLAALGPSVLPVNHGRVLVGTSIDDRLFTVVQYETHEALRSEPSASSLYNEARSRLIVYLLLVSAGYGSWRTTTVARGGQGSRFSEVDPATSEVRRILVSRPEMELRNSLPDYLTERAVDMLTTTIPGTGMRVGLSYGLFRTCQVLMDSLRESIVDVVRDHPDWSRFGTDVTAAGMRAPGWSEEQEIEEVADFKEAVDQRSRDERQRLNLAYELGDRVGPQALDYPARLLEPQDLEMYTSDTYLALSPTSTLMSPLF